MISTIVFYACIIPVLLLVVGVLMPGLPSPLEFPLPPKAINLGRYRRAKRVLNALNPLKWMMLGLYRLALLLVSISSARELHANFSPSFRHSARSVDRNAIHQTWQKLQTSELPTVVQLVKILQHAQDRSETLDILCLIVQACAWKLNTC